MNLDIFLLVAAQVLTLLLAGLGVEMANNPPTESKRKRSYRLVFLTLGLLTIGVNIWLATRTSHEQSRAAADRQNLQTQLNQALGKLDAIAGFVSHPPSQFDPSQIAAAVRAMARPPKRGWPGDSTDAHSVAVFKFLSTNFPEVMDLNERERFYVYYLMQHGGNMSSTPDEWTKLEKLYAAQFHWTDDAAWGVANQSFDKLRELKFLQTPGVQEPTLAEPYYSRLRALLKRGEKVP